MVPFPLPSHIGLKPDVNERLQIGILRRSQVAALTLRMDPKANYVRKTLILAYLLLKTFKTKTATRAGGCFVLTGFRRGDSN
jgi:hypothetical protein